jgi:DNA-binding response OmpR family regulator
MDLIAVFPENPSPELARTLDLAGYRWKAFASADAISKGEPSDGWLGAIVMADHDMDGAWAVCRALRKRDALMVPLLLLVTGAQLDELTLRDELFDDFCLLPFHPRELEARLRHVFAHTTMSAKPDTVDYGGLVLNLETYQASIDGHPLDLTYMEYELLKFLTQNPGKVFTREILLSRVWGYDYYGGARTVDVHIRRLRAKLGEEHANLIQTVRSVGYRFGQSRWGN